jgi:YHS domain-containing protein
MKKSIALALVAAVLSTPLALAFGPQDAKSNEQIIKEQLPSYPVAPCIVSGEEIEEAVDLVHEGRLVRLCCKSCKKVFVKDPEMYLAELDKLIVAEQLPTYPLETCAISGEKLGSMGEPLEYIHGTRLVRLCCKGCVKGMQKKGEEALAKVNEALIAAQLPTYPLETCVVSGEKLGSMGDPIDYLYGTKLVRFCCKGCVGRFQKDPQKALAKLAAK